MFKESLEKENVAILSKAGESKKKGQKHPLDLTTLKLSFTKAVSMKWKGRNQIAMNWKVNGAQGMRDSTTCYHFKTQHRGKKRVMIAGYLE